MFSRLPRIHAPARRPHSPSSTDSLQRRSRRPAALAGLIAGLLAIGSPPAFAAVFNIAAGDVSGLIGAINTANSNGEDDTINLAAGTYTLTAVDNTDEGPSGLPTITSTIAIIGAGAGSTIVERGGGSPDFRVFTARATHDLVLRGLTIRGGQNPASDGGGIFARDGRLTIDQCVVTMNSANYGGGVEYFREDGEITDSDISVNTVPGNGGGARFVGRYVASVRGSTFTGNTAGSGGGIEAGPFFGETASVEISDSVVSGNVVTANAGGALQVYDGLVTINRTTIANNANALPGGTITAWGTRLVVSESTIANNVLSDGVQLIGGPLYIPSGRSAEVTVTNSTISGNSLAGFGFIGGKNILRVDSSTVTGNNLGFHVSTAEIATIRNSIVSGNTTGACDSKLKSEGANIVQNDPGCTFADKPSDQVGADPMLGPLASNGGPTMTHALLAGSAAIDTGANCPGTDQRGLARPADGNGDTTEVCDVGAVEANAVVVAHSPDSFLCYKANTKRSTPDFPGAFGFSLTDIFESKLFDAPKGKSLCTPADESGNEATDPTIFLRGYEAKEATGALPHTAQLGIRVRNALGELSVDTVKVERILVPSSWDLSTPPLPPLASNVDSFKCYKAKTSPGTAKFPKGRVIELRDALEHRLFDVVKPTRLCTAVNRAGGGVLHPADHLMCYQVKPSKPKPLGAFQLRHTPVDIFAANDLDDEALTTVKEEELCVPSSVTP